MDHELIRSIGSLAVRSTNERTSASQANGDHNKIRNLKSVAQDIFTTFSFRSFLPPWD